MSAKNKLVVPGAENVVEEHKEEIAEEFGTHASPASRDVITPKIREERKNRKEKGKDNEDMV